MSRHSGSTAPYPDLSPVRTPRESMRFDAVIFDLDGTLADTLETIAAALNHGLGACGRPPLDLPEVARIVGEGVATLCEKALPGGSPDAVATLIRVTRWYYARNAMF